MKNIFIDKFYRLYNPYKHREETEHRAAAEDKTECIELTDNKWNAKKRKLSNLNSGQCDDDAVTVSQIPKLNKDDWDFKNKVISNIKPGKLDSDAVCRCQVITENNAGHWQARCKKIVQVSEGQDMGDVAIVGQVLRYDPKKNIFKCGDKEFDLVINTPSNPVLVADVNTISGLRKYKDKEYRHKTHVYNQNRKLVSIEGSTFSFDKDKVIIDQLRRSIVRLPDIK